MPVFAPAHGHYDAAVIGGGFFGCRLALFLSARFHRVLILEREPDLLTRASFANQARVHNGYHYPRSMMTGLRSAANYRRFVRDYEDCVEGRFLQVYAIARNGSRVSAYQYRRFCESVGIPLTSVPDHIARLFNSDLIEEAFGTEECAFNAARLREKLRASLESAEVEIGYGADVERVLSIPGGGVRILIGGGVCMDAGFVCNCTYSDINRLLARSSLELLPLKHELAELALLRMPPELQETGITVMDGPFFSVMPFPGIDLHSLSHVTYTPHESWQGADSAWRIVNKHPSTRSVYMLRDAQRYVPVMSAALYEGSLFETKTVLVSNEANDGRPIMYRRNHGIRNFSVILGAKIDNIYDVLTALDADLGIVRGNHELTPMRSHAARAAWAD